MSSFLPSFSFLQDAIHEQTRVFLFAEFFISIFKTRVESGFLLKSANRKTVNNMEQKTWVLCQIDVQEFHLYLSLSKKSSDRQEYKTTTQQD